MAFVADHFLEEASEVAQKLHLAQLMLSKFQSITFSQQGDRSREANETKRMKSNPQSCLTARFQGLMELFFNTEDRPSWQSSRSLRRVHPGKSTAETRIVSPHREFP